MLAVLADGPRTAYEVAQAVRWTSRNKALPDLDLMNQMLAIGETLSHLDLLVARGQAAVDTDGQIRYYRPAEPTPAKTSEAAG